MKEMEEKDGKTKKRRMTKKEIERILTEYRQAILEKGYKGITKEMINTIMDHGTARDKTTLLFNAYWDIDPGEDGRLTEEQERILRESVLRKGTIAEITEHYECMFVFSSFIEFRYPFYAMQYQFLTSLNNAALHIARYEEITRATAMLNQFYKLLNGELTEEMKSLIAKYSETVSYTTIYGKIKQNEEGIFYVEGEKEYLEFICSLADDTKAILQGYKSVVEGIHKWAESKDMLSIVPYLFRSAKDSGNQDTLKESVTKDWYHYYLVQREQAGIKVSQEEREKAILPIYDEVEILKDTEDLTIKKLEESYEIKKRDFKFN